VNKKWDKIIVFFFNSNNSPKAEVLYLIHPINWSYQVLLIDADITIIESSGFDQNNEHAWVI